MNKLKGLVPKRADGLGWRRGPADRAYVDRKPVGRDGRMGRDGQKDRRRKPRKVDTGGKDVGETDRVTGTERNGVQSKL